MRGDPVCPRCLSDVFTIDDGQCPGSFGVSCSKCEWHGVSDSEAEALDMCRYLCHQEIRPRLPTLDEEKAHAEMHGSKAQWLVEDGLIGMAWQANAGELAELRGWAVPDGGWRSYPAVGLRPVAWPEAGE